MPKLIDIVNWYRARPWWIRLLLLLPFLLLIISIGVCYLFYRRAEDPHQRITPVERPTVAHRTATEPVVQKLDQRIAELDEQIEFARREQEKLAEEARVTNRQLHELDDTIQVADLEGLKKIMEDKAR